MNNSKSWIVIGGLLGVTGIALGAFVAHGLKDTLSTEMMEAFKTGNFYHLIHTVVIISIALSSRIEFYKSAIFLLAGIVLFSFSLYVFAYSQIKLFAFITPFGGISFLVGWVLVIYAGVRNFKHN